MGLGATDGEEGLGAGVLTAAFLPQPATETLRTIAADKANLATRGRQLQFCGLLARVNIFDRRLLLLVVGEYKLGTDLTARESLWKRGEGIRRQDCVQRGQVQGCVSR